ncbi:MAG TPA: coniferyl aldehyde dehydrogenase [Ramlibacter sp.]|nr:coniferyl aldehyde dehydrogenase [Ramlibacter sp.]
MRDALSLQRTTFAREMNPPLALRRDRLDRLAAMTERIAPALVEALSQDFGHRSAHVTRLADVMMVMAAISHTRRHLKKWMRTRRVATPLAFQPAASRLMPQPLGVVGIVSPWNYPYQLAIAPAAAALAAGNRVMIKPSELTPRCSELMRQAVADSFAADEMVVVTGDAQVGKGFVALPFDHLLFTGSTAVGRQVALAAAANLTPVTLELGGKSPAILSPDCDLRQAATSLALGKMFNAGQTCIAPDYVAVPRAMVEPFTSAMADAVRRLYPDLAVNPDVTSIVSDRHFERLQALQDDALQHGARIVPLAPETPGRTPRLMRPALVLDVTDGMRIMREEIFGPLLPVLAYDQLDEVIGHVNRNDRPLALYWYGKDRQARERVLRETISGGVTINDCMWHFGQEELPFGGVGASGTGAYHGEAGFRTFSKDKPVFIQSRLSGVPLLHPPYGGVFEFMARVLKHIT